MELFSGVNLLSQTLSTVIQTHAIFLVIVMFNEEHALSWELCTYKFPLPVLV